MFLKIPQSVLIEDKGGLKYIKFGTKFHITQYKWVGITNFYVPLKSRIF